MRWAPMPSRAEEHFKTVLQWLAIALLALIVGIILHKGYVDVARLAEAHAPDIDARAVLAKMHALAPDWLAGCRWRECWFEPTFHKHVGKLCAGVQMHVDDGSYGHETFRPWRAIALVFKAIRALYPDYSMWRDFPYEYETGRLAIDLINGSPLLREWVDDTNAGVKDLDALAAADEASWRAERRSLLAY